MFQILNLNEQPFSQAGDWIEGAIILNNKERKMVRGVRMRIYGEEHIEWLDLAGETIIPVTGTEKTIDTVFTLWGFPRGIEKHRWLDVGLYVWPFRFALPSSLWHASFEHESGHVRYIVEACIDVPWDSDIVFSKLIRVAPRSALSMQPQLLVPQSPGYDRIISNCCSLNGEINVNVTCAKRCFAAGDTISVTIDIDNDSGERVNRAKMTLKENFKFEKREGILTAHKNIKREIVSSQFNFRVEPHERNKMIQLDLKVPDWMPLTSFKSQFIERHFALHVKVAIEDEMKFDGPLKFPLVGCSSLTDSGVPPDMAPSILNPEGIPRHRFEPQRGEGLVVAAFCVDGMDYDPRDQIDVNHEVRYPTFYSLDFSLPQTLYQYNQALFHHLLAVIN